MGLDMYAYKTSAKLNESVDFGTQNMDTQEIHYWRKHPNLHGWMEDLYYEKGGKSESFNCVNVELTAEDLMELRSEIESGNLPQTSGFFFGVTDGTEKEDDLEFVNNALQAIEDGDSVFYTSWW